MESYLRPKLLNNPFVSSFLMDLDFLLPHITYFGNIFILSFLVFKILGFMFLFFLHFKQQDNTVLCLIF